MKKGLQETLSWLFESDFPDLTLSEIKLELDTSSGVEFMFIRYNERGWVIRYKSHEGRGLGPVEALEDLKKIDAISEELYEALPDTKNDN